VLVEPGLSVLDNFHAAALDAAPAPVILPSALRLSVLGKLS